MNHWSTWLLLAILAIAVALWAYLSWESKIRPMFDSLLWTSPPPAPPPNVPVGDEPFASLPAKQDVLKVSAAHYAEQMREEDSAVTDALVSRPSEIAEAFEEFVAANPKSVSLGKPIVDVSVPHTEGAILQSPYSSDAPLINVHRLKHQRSEAAQKILHNMSDDSIAALKETLAWVNTQWHCNGLGDATLQQLVDRHLFRTYDHALATFTIGVYLQLIQQWPNFSGHVRYPLPGTLAEPNGVKAWNSTNARTAWYDGQTAEFHQHLLSWLQFQVGLEA